MLFDLIKTSSSLPLINIKSMYRFNFDAFTWIHEYISALISERFTIDSFEQYLNNQVLSSDNEVLRYLKIFSKSNLHHQISNINHCNYPRYIMY